MNLMLDSLLGQFYHVAAIHPIVRQIGTPRLDAVLRGVRHSLSPLFRGSSKFRALTLGIHWLMLNWMYRNKMFLSIKTVR